MLGKFGPIVRFHELDGDDEILIFVDSIYYLVGGAMCPS